MQAPLYLVLSVSWCFLLLSPLPVDPRGFNISTKSLQRRFSQPQQCRYFGPEDSWLGVGEHRVFSSIPNPCSVETHSKSQVVTIKNSSRHCQLSPGSENSLQQRPCSNSSPWMKVVSLFKTLLTVLNLSSPLIQIQSYAKKVPVA